MLMRKTAVMRRIASVLTVGALAAGLASCTIGDTDNGEALESAAHTEGQETEKMPEPPEFSFTDGDEEVAPEQMARNRARQARKNRVVMPRSVPLKSNAHTAMRAAEIAWPHEPISHTFLREAWDVTHGLSANCGNIEPDSRIGTRKDVNTAGTPAAVNIQARTVFGATI